MTRVEQSGTIGDRRLSRAPRRTAAFTLLDVLVTMAVISVLIAILSPALSSIRESARQVVCRSNVRQMGIGISLFAENNKDLIPPSVNSPLGQGNAGDPWDTMELRLADANGQPGMWDGIGHLYEEQILPAPRLFYCPSHHGNHPYADYSGAWSGGVSGIVGNFQYRAAGLSQRRTLANPNPQTAFLSRMLPQSALVADGMRTQEDFNHSVGANVLRAGLSVDWWRDPGTFVDHLPKDGQVPSSTDMQIVWDWLDSAPH